MAETAGAVGERDIEFNVGDFERVRSMIRAKAGIDLNPGKQNMVYSRLARPLRERGYRAFRPYLDSLQTASEAEWQEFINCLTTNLTSFFREAHHFPILGDHLKKRHPAPQRIWCCAASTGEEPYTIAMQAISTLGPQAPVTMTPATSTRACWKPPGRVPTAPRPWPTWTQACCIATS